MAILKRPMFRKGGSANEGIMHGLERRGYDKGSEKDEYKSEDFWNSIVGRTLRIPGDYIAKPVNNVATQSLVNPLFGTELEQLETPYDAADAWLWNKMGKGYHPIYNPDGDPKTDDFVDKTDWGYENLRFKKAEGPKELEDPIEMIKGPPDGTQLPYVPKKRIETGNQLEKIIAKKESLSDRNKRYMDMMAPHMQKRMVADALGAASESFEKSTGNTKQDIARALGAAGRAMSDTRDIADKVSMLTLQGEIQKDIGTSIEAAKEKQLGNYQFLAKLSKEDPETFNKIMKQEDKNKYEELLDQTGSTDSASRLWAKRKYSDVVDTFSAAEAKKVKVEDLADGVYYVGMGEKGDRFFKVEGGKIDGKFSRSGVL